MILTDVGNSQAIPLTSGRTHLVGSNPIGERLLDAISSYSADDEIWEPGLERDE